MKKSSVVAIHKDGTIEVLAKLLVSARNDDEAIDVMIGEHWYECWTDKYFHCNTSSIAPYHDWTYSWVNDRSVLILTEERR